MIQSMTGYGKGEVSVGNKKISVEIRSLNSKQLDLSVRIPSVYRVCEHEIRTLAGRRLQRGKVDIFVGYEIAGGANTVTINRAAFADYYRQLKEIAKECRIDTTGSMWGDTQDVFLVQSIMRMPEVVQNEASEVSDEEIAALKQAAEAAMDQMEAFRSQEGKILIDDLLARVDTIERLKNDVVPFEAVRVETVKNRIRENLESLNIPLDSNRLEQEMIFYIEKLDVTEEKVRLQNHLNYFREVAAGEEAPGRKLGFIAQEMGREINTLGSKANHADIQRLVVQMKDELEKIKEQLLNLL